MRSFCTYVSKVVFLFFLYRSGLGFQGVSSVGKQENSKTINMTGFNVSPSGDQPTIEEAFEIAFQKLFPDRPLVEDTMEKPQLPIVTVKTFCFYSRVRARILKINEDSFRIVGNSLYFRLPEEGGLCKQNVEDFETFFNVDTLCIRDDYVLMEFSFQFPK